MGKGSNVSKANKSREQAAKRAAEEGKGGGGAEGIKARSAGLSVVCVRPRRGAACGLICAPARRLTRTSPTRLPLQVQHLPHVI